MQRRLIAVFLIFLFVFLVIFFRLFYWQVINSEQLTGLAEKQATSANIIPAKRGKIFAADGSPLVINQRVVTVYAEPQKIKDIQSTSAKLALTLNLPEASIAAKLKQTGLQWIPIAYKVSEDIEAKIKENQLPGIGFLDDLKRFYPEASMAAHLLGFVGKNYQGEDQGYFGIEGYYDEQIRGRKGMIFQEKDASGNPIILGENREIASENGRDLYLTIDKTVQYIVETKLKEGLEKYKAKGGSIIVMDPFTGAVIAMASYPNYDPREYDKYSSDLYKNPAVSSMYEPGSTFKVLVMAGALNDKKVKPDTEFDETGPVEIGGYTINTWNQKYHGKIKLAQILEYSSNVGMVFVENKLGDDNLVKYIDLFGFGKNTGIDLQEEYSVSLRPKDKWYQIDYATASFGQGIAVTPLQMIRAVAAIANGGNIMKPYLVKAFKLNDGKEITTLPKIERKVINREVANYVSEMMVAAVDNGETKRIKPAGFRIAGKTGTAQIPIAGHYDAEKTIASFVGFAPVSRPKFVMLVTVREPSTSIWGSETAAPIFFAITRELLNYYGISPNE